MPVCTRCNIWPQNERPSVRNGLCCNKCPNHGPWCTQYYASSVASSTATSSATPSATSSATKTKKDRTTRQRSGSALESSKPKKPEKLQQACGSSVQAVQDPGDWVDFVIDGLRPGSTPRSKPRSTPGSAHGSAPGVAVAEAWAPESTALAVAAGSDHKEVPHVSWPAHRLRLAEPATADPEPRRREEDAVLTSRHGEHPQDTVPRSATSLDSRPAWAPGEPTTAAFFAERREANGGLTLQQCEHSQDNMQRPAMGVDSRPEQLLAEPAAALPGTPLRKENDLLVSRRGEHQEDSMQRSSNTVDSRPAQALVDPAAAPPWPQQTRRSDVLMLRHSEQHQDNMHRLAMGTHSSFITSADSSIDSGSNKRQMMSRTSSSLQPLACVSYQATTTAAAAASSSSSTNPAWQVDHVGRFIENPQITQLNAMLKAIDAGDRIIKGRLELFSFTRRTLTKRQQHDLMRRAPDSFTESPLGPMSTDSVQSLFVGLVSLISMLFVDHDVTNITPNDFEPCPDRHTVVNMINHHLGAVVDRVHTGFLVEFWQTVSDSIDVINCEIYAFTPAAGTFEPIHDSLSFCHYFFYNVQAGRILFVGSVTKSRGQGLIGSSNASMSGDGQMEHDTTDASVSSVMEGDLAFGSDFSSDNPMVD